MPGKYMYILFFHMTKNETKLVKTDVSLMKMHQCKTTILCYFLGEEVVTHKELAICILILMLQLIFIE